MSLEGDPTALSRFFIQYSGTGPTTTQLQTFCDSVSTAWGSNLAGLANANIIQEPINCEELTGSTAPVATGLTTHNGSRVGAPIAAGSAAMIQYVIARRYRGGKPKGFWPFGVAGDLTNSSTWGSTFLTNVASDWNAFIAAVNGAGWTGAGALNHVNVSYYAGFHSVQNPVTLRWRNIPTLRPGGPVIDGVVSYGVEVGVASQRRRNNV
jgi:hypothetical protein